MVWLVVLKHWAALRTKQSFWDCPGQVSTMNTLLKVGRRRQSLLAGSRAFATQAGNLTGAAPAKLPKPSPDSPFLRFATPVPQPTNHQQIYSTIPQTEVITAAVITPPSLSHRDRRCSACLPETFVMCRSQLCLADCVWLLRPGHLQTQLQLESGLMLAADMRLKSTTAQLTSWSTCLSKALRYDLLGLVTPGICSMQTATATSPGTSS